MTPSAALLERKHDRCFGHIDVNGNGFVESDDVVALATRLLDAFNEPADGEKGRTIIDAFHDFWEALISAIDLDGDRRIAPSEWRAGMVGAFVEAEGGFEAALRPAVHAMMNLADTTGDGVVGPEEFRVLQAALGTTAEAADAGFAAMDTDGSGTLTVDELVEASRQYYTSSDEGAGNRLFGPI